MLTATYIAAALIVIATPGPDMLNSLAIGMSRGRREGVAYALGVGVGCGLHTLWAVLGVSAIVAASSTLFAAIKWLGVAYLIYLGVQALRAPPAVGKLSEGHATPHATPQASIKRRFLDGVLTNALNPKVMLFFLAFLPQFLLPVTGSIDSVAMQMLSMGAFFAAVTTVCYCLLAAFGGRMGQRLSTDPRFAHWLSRATGVLFIALAVRLGFVDGAATPRS